MDIADHAEDLVREFAGAACKEPAVFDYDDDILDNWVFFTLDNRDSDILAQSNADAIVAELEQWKGQDVIFGTASHWGFGWVDFAFVRPYDEHGHLTLAMLSLAEMHCALSEYPILDEEDFSRREYERQLESIREELLWCIDDDLASVDWERQVFGVIWDSHLQYDVFDEDYNLTGPATKVGLQACLDLGYIKCDLLHCGLPATTEDPYDHDSFWCTFHTPREEN